MLKIRMKWPAMIAAMLLLVSCGGGSDTRSSDESGTLSVSMVDDSDQSFQSVYVTIKEVQVCREAGDAEGAEADAETDEDCGWQTVAIPNQTFDLLTLVNGVMATLGQKDLPAGTYHQIRLVLGNQADNSLNILGQPHPAPQYLIDFAGEVHAMKVPSGYQTGIKLVSPFEIEADRTTELILDFDVTRSIHLAGRIENEGKYILRPTIKVIGTHNRTVVSGTVADDALPAGTPLIDAAVTAWKLETGAPILSSGTRSDENGQYTLYLDSGEDPGLDPKTYLLVAGLEGYAFGCREVNVMADQTYPEIDFTLPVTETVTVSGTVTGTAEAGLAEAPVVHIGFIQPLCPSAPVEVAFAKALDDGDASTTDIYYDSDSGRFQYFYERDLPAGTYDLQASSGNSNHIERDVTISTATIIDFALE